jgi:hypothetical protein
LKIPDVTSLFLYTIHRVSSIDSAEMANYLTNQERKKIAKELLSIKGDITHEMYY